MDPFSDFKLLAILILLLLLFLFLTKRTNYRHKRNISTGKKVLGKINNLEHPGAKLNYLKKVDPFVFEELILSAFQQKGFKIKRNKKYTGDDGIDGIIWDENKRKYLIQAKRYAGYVSRQHIKEFELLVAQRKCFSGFFVHTGKTGKDTYKHFYDSNIHIVSGQRLLKLITIDQKK